MFPLDIELERTLRNLRKVKNAEITIMAKERMGLIVEQEIAAERPPMQDTMEDFWRPFIQKEYSAVKQLAIEANNFELKPGLITMVQHNQFTSHSNEDPNEHIGKFLRMANIVKLNRLRLEVIKLNLFPFFLRHIVETWY